VTPRGFHWDESLKISAEYSFNRGDVEAIIGRHAVGVVIRFAGLPEIKGKQATDQFPRALCPAEKLPTQKDLVHC
jgi:hypothetical protein